MTIYFGLNILKIMCYTYLNNGGYMIGKIKYILLTVFLVTVLTGCTTSDLSMEIDSEGTVKLTHTILVDKDDFEIFNTIIKADEEASEKNKYSIEKIILSDKMGYKMYKTLGVIEGVDNNKGENVELAEYANNDFKDSVLFKHKKGLFTNIYEANYNIDLTDINKAIVYIPVFNGSAYSNGNAEDFDILDGKVSTTFSLDSAFNVGDNNATKTENGKYIWELKYGEVNKIYFEINRLDTSMVVTTSFIAIIAGFCYLLVYYRKQKLRAYSRVSLRESLDLENKIVTRGEVRDIRMKRKYSTVDENAELDAFSINERLTGKYSSLGAYSNQETVEELNKRISDDKAEEDIVPINEQKNPKFRSIDDQVRENIKNIKNAKNIKEDSNKFIDEEEK